MTDVVSELGSTLTTTVETRKMQIWLMNHRTSALLYRYRHHG